MSRAPEPAGDSLTSLAISADVADLDLDRRLVATAVDGEIDSLPDTNLLDLVGQISEPLDLPLVRPHDHIANRAGRGIHAAQPRLFRRRAGPRAHHHHALEPE